MNKPNRVANQERRRSFGRKFEVRFTDNLGPWATVEGTAKMPVVMRVWAWCARSLPYGGDFVEVSQADVARRLGCSQPMVSRALKDLRAVGLIEGKQVGRRWRYRQNPLMGWVGTPEEYVDELNRCRAAGPEPGSLEGTRRGPSTAEEKQNVLAFPGAPAGTPIAPPPPSKPEPRANREDLEHLDKLEAKWAAEAEPTHSEADTAWIGETAKSAAEEVAAAKAARLKSQRAAAIRALQEEQEREAQGQTTVSNAMARFGESLMEEAPDAPKDMAEAVDRLNAVAARRKSKGAGQNVLNAPRVRRT